MDTRNKEQEKVRRREEALARRVGAALDQLNPQGAGECPDAEVIAAYHERSLSAEETAQWETHFATCARCRKVLLVLAASSDAPLTDKEVARLGELVSAGRAGLEKPAKPVRPAWTGIRDWRMRWVAPALGAAAVLLVWVAMRVPWRGAQDAGSRTFIAQAPKTETPPSYETRGAAPESPAAAPQPRSETETPSQKEPSLSYLPSQNAPAKPADKNLLDQRRKPPNPGARESESSSEEKKAAAAGSASGQAGGLAPSPQKADATAIANASNQESLARAQTPAPPKPEAPSSAAQTVTVTEAAPAIDTAQRADSKVASRDKQTATSQTEMAATLASGRGAGQGTAEAVPLNKRSVTAVSRFRGTAGLVAFLKAPSGSVLWRAGGSGAIERSADGGQTWTPQASPSREDWLAGAAASDTVCWLAGRNGAIARTADGQHWDLVAPPAQAPTSAGALSDWTGIAARDAQSATVTARDGRRYATQDAGKTWQLQ